MHSHIHIHFERQQFRIPAVATVATDIHKLHGAHDVYYYNN
jgi:hypothetical protein